MKNHYCIFCDKTFENEPSLMRHIKSNHPDIQQSLFPEDGSLDKNYKFLKFKSQEALLKWKKEMEQRTGSSYVKFTGQVIKPNGDVHVYYDFCHSGTDEPLEEEISTKLNPEESKKINENPQSGTSDQEVFDNNYNSTLTSKHMEKSGNSLGIIYQRTEKSSERKEKSVYIDNTDVEYLKMEYKIRMEVLRQNLDSIAQNRMTLCHMCGKEVKERSLQNHIKMIHEDINPYQSNIPCLDCDEKLSTRTHLIKHLQEVHKKSIESVSKEFLEYSEFQLWLDDIQKVSASKYVKLPREKKIDNGSIIKFICYHDVQATCNKDDENGKRSLKQTGNKKSENICTSHIVMNTILSPKPKLSITYYKTHYGHEKEVINESNSDKENTASQPDLNVSTEKVIENSIHNVSPKKLSKANTPISKRKDVAKIQSDYGLEIIEGDCIESVVASSFQQSDNENHDRMCLGDDGESVAISADDSLVKKDCTKVKKDLIKTARNAPNGYSIRQVDGEPPVEITFAGGCAFVTLATDPKNTPNEDAIRRARRKANARARSKKLNKSTPVEFSFGDNCPLETISTVMNNTRDEDIAKAVSTVANDCSPQIIAQEIPNEIVFVEENYDFVAPSTIVMDKDKENISTVLSSICNNLGNVDSLPAGKQKQILRYLTIVDELMSKPISLSEVLNNGRRKRKIVKPRLPRRTIKKMKNKEVDTEFVESNTELFLQIDRQPHENEPWINWPVGCEEIVEG